jgi:hypothetical protein
VSRPALGPTQPPVQWVPGVFSLGVKRGRGVMLTTHPYLVPRSWMSRSYTALPPSASMACRGTALFFLNPFWKSDLPHNGFVRQVVVLVLTCLYGRSLSHCHYCYCQYPLYRRQGGLHSRSGHTGYRNNSFASAGNRTSIARSSDTILTELPGSSISVLQKGDLYGISWGHTIQKLPLTCVYFPVHLVSFYVSILSAYQEKNPC